MSLIQRLVLKPLNVRLFLTRDTIFCRSVNSKHAAPSTEGLPEIDWEDVEEKGILGSGPGGQAIQKSHNACQLKHLPTGIVVKVTFDVILLLLV